MSWADDSSAVTSVSIPPITSKTNTYEIDDYSLGMDSFISNDKFPVKNGGTNMWRLAQDARITTLGDYETRKGFDFHSVAAGETQDQAITSTTGAADQSFSTVIRLAQPFTAATTGALNRLDINLKNAANGTGTVVVSLYTDSGTAPANLIASTSISASDLTTSYAYLTARFPSSPTITASTKYWIVLYIQDISTNSYSWSSTTSATTSLVSADSGMTWSANTFALNFKQYYATVGGAKGLYRAYKSDGTKVTLLAHGTTLYSVDNTTGALTAIKTGLSPSATNYRFAYQNDVIYYVNNFDGYRKWDFTTETQVNTNNYGLICSHKGLIFLGAGADPNAIIYSNFGLPETFTSTDFVYADAPKTGDKVTAIISLNGSLLIFNQNNKFILSGSSNIDFAVDEAPDQKGTYTQETVTQDNNFVYFLSDDGVYRSNGSEGQLLSENNYQDILTLANKTSVVMCRNQGRLYMWYQSSTSGFNDACWVYNLNFSSGGSYCLESSDTDAFVSRAYNAYDDDDNMLVASSIVGQVYWQEKDSNDYSNLGSSINTEWQTHYLVGDSPAVLKEYRYWEPRFGAQSGNYTIDCDYASDLRGNWETYSSESVQGIGPIWGSGIIWGQFIWGITHETQAQLYIPGEYRRTAVRYKHHAMRQPVSFLGHTLVAQQRRIR